MRKKFNHVWIDSNAYNILIDEKLFLESQGKNATLSDAVRRLVGFKHANKGLVEQNKRFKNRIYELNER